jgi:hypothetical protein
MKYVLIGLGILVGLVVLAFVALVINLQLATRRQRNQVMARLAPVLEPILEGAPPDRQAIAAQAEDAEVRNHLFNALDKLGYADLFPSEYRTVEAFAESVLVSWLCHPNELKRAPDAIHLVDKHVVDSGTELGDVAYFLFRFRVEEPHFAADQGWMAGVCGPFLNTPDPPLITPTGMFSELDPFKKMQPEEHVQLVHESAVNYGAIEKLQRAVNAAKNGG